MADRLDGRKVAFLLTDGVEQVELTEPWKRVEDEGGIPELISIEQGEVQGYNHRDKADKFPVDRLVTEADQTEFDGLVLPGGVVNPDNLRTNDDAVRFVRSFFEAGKPVAAICHGPWMLVEADVVNGRTLTSWPSVKTDIANAGGTWVDEEVHVDSGLVTSRNPDDLPAFCDKLAEEICERRHEKQALKTS
jgi:protease I